MTHGIREATESDADEVVRLLDAAMLEFDRERARQRVEDESVLVAVLAGHNRDERRSSGGSGPAAPDESDRSGSTAPGESDRSGSTAPDDRVVGACVLREPDAEPTEPGYADGPPTEIEQIAVHRSRRGRGIGAMLVDAAAARTDGPLVACFREQVWPFYESLGFEIRDADLDSTCSGSDDTSGERLRGVLR